MIFKTAITSALLAIGLLLWSAPAGCQEIGTVQVSDLRLRSGPGKAYRIIARLDKGTTVSVIGRVKEWLKVDFQQQIGYIIDSADYVKVTRLSGTVATGEKKTIKSAAVSADTIERRLEAATSEIADITRREHRVLETFNEAEKALNRVRTQVRETRLELEALNRRVEEIQQQSAHLERQIASGAAYAAKRLVALYKLNWLGRVQLLATAESFFDFINRKASLERILGQDEALLDKLNDDQIALEALLTRLNASKAEKRSLELALKERADQLNLRQEDRKDRLAAIRSEKALELAALKSLQEAARQLDATLKVIGPASEPGSPKTTVGGAERPFSEYKGLLSWPVKGKIVSFFGPYRDRKYAVTSFRSGINIRAERGEPIRAVSRGHTIYASWFKGFGNMMILDHGNHYYTVYAHLEEVFKVKGDRVDKDEVIATVGDSGSLTGPALHFEVRHHGKPVDPLEWIRKG
jgi:septal ring factor EnvC (AmiA/AmiB activator)